jgi:hypothetical protein
LISSLWRVVIEAGYRIGPRPLWGKSLASTFPKDKWKKLRDKRIQDKGEKCEICGQAGRVELHEVWEYMWVVWLPLILIYCILK